MLNSLNRFFGGDSVDERAATGALAEYYRTPAPSRRTPVAKLPLLAVDVETTGLDYRKDRLLSIGWVPVNGHEIDLSGAGYGVIEQESHETVGESATIHGLTDDHVDREGEAAPAVLARLLEALRGRAMLVHFKKVESSFISDACQDYFGTGLKTHYVDTFELARRFIEDGGGHPKGDDLRLARVRERLNLPNYHNHNALTDALACAEVYLALVARNRGKTLGALL
ncbi:exonuclease domain-containing protein [Corynebacterium sp. HMSC28B08]|uniref:exonuclease domain-containing protein n=1 Tax=Corynebacterium sp. HMSC28B08 TaxID=1581066 RepID=UPI0008A1FE33|nr:exonuclease domain-containing protein [Corynebacterium sp. HMSC28B08]OFT87984.1 DNA polymerase III subunit epsilon [Corynebacterium sp. HMSC28B08]